MGGQKDTNQIATDVRHPAQTTRRALEDLTAHGLVDLERQGQGKANLWTLSAFTTARLQVFPEMSELRGTFPETLEGVNGLSVSSSCKPLEAQNGNANKLENVQTAPHDPELVSRYTLEPPPTHTPDYDEETAYLVAKYNGHPAGPDLPD
jgi:hypothetical protein